MNGEMKLQAWQRRGLVALAFLSGGCVMALEITGGRMLIPTFGNSVEVWGSVISVFLGALSLGYFLGGLMADRLQPGHSLVVLSLALLLAGAKVTALAAVYVGINEWVFNWGTAVRWGALVSATIEFGVAGTLFGMVSPVVVRLTARSLASVGNTTGGVYGLSTLGSILGTLFTTFVLIPSIGTRMILIGIGIASAIQAVLTLWLGLPVILNSRER